MSNEIHKEYPIPSKEQLDSNSSFFKMLNLVGTNKSVVDFGCATGYFSKIMADEGCDVVGVEINPEAAKEAEKYCRKVIVADLDQQNLEDILAEEKFEVAVFGDVLEHLKDPWRVLESVKNILKPEGYVIASIPNIAHGAIRLALLKGQFEYSELGILDDTHLRFFTQDSVRHLFEQAGYFIEAEDSTKLPVFDVSALTPDIKPEDFAPELIDLVTHDQNSEVLQFIIRAYPWSMAQEYGALKRKLESTESSFSQLSQDFSQKQAKWQQVEAAFQEMQTELKQTQAELQRSQQELQTSQAKLHQSQTDLSQTQTDFHHAQAELHHTQAELHHTQTELHHTREALDQARAETLRLSQMITAMKSSKFWKLRKVWIKFLSGVGIKR